MFICFLRYKFCDVYDERHWNRINVFDLCFYSSNCIDFCDHSMKICRDVKKKNDKNEKKKCQMLWIENWITKYIYFCVALLFVC